MPEGIADLSYRHYGGGMGKASGAWKVICRETVKKSFANRAFWILTSITGWYYAVILAVLYVTEQSLQSQMAGGRGGGIDPMKEVFNRIVWQDQFYWGFNSTHLLLFIVSLIVGTGVIANDNRSNALLIYLARPCTRGTYLFGKWLGVFTALFVASLIPALVFWIYGALNYRPYDFLSDDPWLILRIIGIAAFNAGLLASLAVGISSLFRQPRMAGATMAGLYFISYFVTLLFRGIASSPAEGIPEGLKAVAEKVSYMSINGLMQGASKIILNTTGGSQFGFSAGPRGNNGPAPIPIPENWLIFGLAGIVIFISIAIAASRIRAVEVVK